ncbi:MAG: heme o synthase [Acidiferrobacteraceae bacterium]
MKTSSAAIVRTERGGFAWKAREYLELGKPRVVALIVFTAVVGMFLSTPGLVPWHVLILGTIGIGLAASSAAAINHVLDRKSDAIMARTCGRPLPQGTVTNTEALLLALTVGVFAMVVLALWVNPLTAVLTFLSLIGYAVVYTVFLKRATPQNIVIGGAAGAAPPILGWAAVTGHVDPNALILFLIIFTWTPPHFWSLALYRELEYEKVGIPMLPVTHGSRYTRLHILLYTLMLVAVSLMPFASGMSGVAYLVGVSLLDGVFLYYAIRLYVRYSDRLAQKTFYYSIQYLSALFALLLFDHYRGYFSSMWRVLG